jgi:hypothetical protein
MRAFVRTLSLLLAVAPALLLPAEAGAQERRVVTTEGADYFGADYDVRRDLELDACEAACVGDAQCQAFTYNPAAKWCFLKNGVGELRSVEGAISGRIVAAAEVKPDVEAQRISELSYLPQAYVDEARRFAGRTIDVGAGDTLDATLASAESLRSQGDPLAAADQFRKALTFAPDRVDLWTLYAETALQASSDNWEIQEKLNQDRTSAAINAFLRSVSPEEQAQSLNLLGRALSERSDWKPAIRAFRASLAVVDNPALRDHLDSVVAEHGFRIVDHTVESDAAAPRICLNFSDRLAEGRGDLADFVTVEGGANLAVEAAGQQICIDGVEHGRRYHVTAREGLPAADGETLLKTAALDIFVRDRAPSVRFLGNAYVLPAGGEPTIPVVTVNTTRVNAELFRIGDRQLAAAVANGNFLNQLSDWETDEIEAKSGVKVWEGTVDVSSEVNREITTAIPVGALEDRLELGAYVLTAEAINRAEEWAPKATQWFVVTDLGLTTLSGNDGLHVMVRSLGSAGPVADVALRLVAVNNEVLGEARTDPTGYANFAPGLMRGTGGTAPGLLVAQGPAGDYSFLDLSRAAMDLTDRGVEGRNPPKPLDVFLTTERGIYRAGETVHATALVRDATAHAVPGVPLTAVVTRPDGKEHSRAPLADNGLGGSVTALNIPANGLRGTWRVGVFADVKGEALAEATFLVEDFDPERLDFDVATTAQVLDPLAPAPLDVNARFLYGAPASGLTVEGETLLKPVREVAGYPGFVFGLHEEPFNAAAEPLTGGQTDKAGRAVVAVKLPDISQSSRPLEATVNVRVLDTSDRPVERNLTVPVLPARSRIGIKPLFDGEAGQNSEVGFELIAVDPVGARVAATDVAWSLYKIEPQFQWYRSDGRWDYERIETRQRVANGTAAIGLDSPARVDARVEWGSYELEVAGPGGNALPASFRFEAGWYVEAKALDTPEALKVSLDKPQYRVGEAARVHLETRFAGVALVMVVDDRLVTTQSVQVTGTSADVEIPVTREWGPGAYVTAVLYRPMDLEAKRMPARAVGLTWAGVDPAERDLQISLQAPDEMRPRQLVDVALQLAGLPAGTEAYVTLAAVDVGILNLTQYQTPDPETYFFGQRRLGMAIRDMYNQLIDRMQGVRGIVRSGGDAMPARFDGPAPTEGLLAFHSGVVRVAPDGTARVSVPLPDFNGTVRLMAMAWTREGVGHAEKELLVRDPVVVTASVPRFLAPGDRSRIAIDVAAVENTAGLMNLSVRSSAGAVTVDPAFADVAVELAPGERRQVLVPLAASVVGDAVLTVALTVPGGEVLEKQLNLAVRVNEPPVATTTFVELAPGGDLSVTPDALEYLLPGTAAVQISASGAGRLNVPAILRALDRYPYGCTEQIASRAMPLVYLNDVALRAGLAGDPEIRGRVEEAIAGVLANQSSSGAFGLWSPGGEDLWLDSYVTEFLTRARQKGFSVPAESFDLALDNLKNRLGYMGEFETGGEAVAYALYVLASNGRASIGDLRYYAETKLQAFGTPLAKAQIGAALALYGDNVRAESVFRAALGDLGVRREDNAYRPDYGSVLRDSAAMLTLASETKAGIDLVALSRRVEQERQSSPHTSTQEDAWSLMAANALMQNLAAPNLAVDGEPVAGPLFRNVDAVELSVSPLRIENRGERPVEVGLTVSGVPALPEPAGGNYYSLKRSYFTLEGQPAELNAVAEGERLVAVLDVTTTETQGARLILDDPLPAGFEIDNPHLLGSGDVANLEWLNLVEQPAHVEFRSDRFIAALDLAPEAATQFQFAYVVRAVSPGSFAHPAALVEDMYRPERRARTDAGWVEIVGPLR